MPLAGRSRRVTHPFDRRALPVLEFPQHKVIFQTVGSDRQVVAVWLQIEQNARALVDTAGQSFEADGYLAIAEAIDGRQHHVGKIGIGLNTIEKFCIALAVERARLLGYATRRLS